MKKLRPNVKALNLKRSKRVMKNRQKGGVFLVRLSKKNKIKGVVKRGHE